MLSNRPDFEAGFGCVCASLGCKGAGLCRFGNGTSKPSFLGLRRGERLAAGNGSCLRFRVVRAGLMAGCAITADGRRQILCLNVPGDTICAMSAAESECWCEALAPTEICEIDLSAHAERLRADPGFSSVLFRLVHDRLERATAHVVSLGRFDGMERVCGFLADMTRRTGRLSGNRWRVLLPMSREDIADYLGLNTDTVSRLLTRIRKAGLVEFRSPSEYEVPCLDRLESRVPIPLPHPANDNPGWARETVS